MKASVRQILTVVFCHTLLLAILVSANFAQETKKQTTAVVVASRTIEKGETLSLKNMSTMSWPKQLTPDETICCPVVVQGKKTNCRIAKGMPIQPSHFQKQQNAIKLRPGHVIVSIKISPESALSGLIKKPNRRVNLIAVVRKDKKITKTLLQDVRVFKINPSTNKNRATVSLEVKSKDAEKIVLAQQIAEIKLMLPANKKAATPVSSPKALAKAATPPEVFQIKEFRDKISGQLKATLADIENLSGVNRDGKQGCPLADSEFEKSLHRQFAKKKYPPQLPPRTSTIPPTVSSFPNHVIQDPYSLPTGVPNYSKPIGFPSILPPSVGKKNTVPQLHPLHPLAKSNPTLPPCNCPAPNCCPPITRPQSPSVANRLPVTGLPSPTPRLYPAAPRTSPPHSINWRPYATASAHSKPLTMVSSDMRSQFRKTAKLLDQYAAEFENQNNYQRADELHAMAKKIRELVRVKPRPAKPQRTARYPR